MLTHICRLFDGKRRFPFDNQAVEVFLEQGLDSFGEISDDLRIQIVDLVQNAEGAVLEDRVSV